MKMTRNNTSPGFTLVEVMVAMLIMMLIILLLSAVFRQMTAAWGVGMRKVKINMHGRVAMDYMAQELALAVTDPVLGTPAIEIPVSRGEITFYTLDNSSINGLTNRALCRVTYEKYGPGLRQLRRRMIPMKWDCAGTYPMGEDNPPPAHSLVNNLLELEFISGDGQMHRTNLPEWLDIKMTLDQDERVSRAVVSSAGPDKLWNTADDITSE